MKQSFIRQTLMNMRMRMIVHVRSAVAVVYNVFVDYFLGVFSSCRVRTACRLLAKNDKARMKVLQTFLLNVPLLFIGLVSQADLVVGLCKSITGMLISPFGEPQLSATTAARIFEIDRATRFVIGFLAVVPYFLVAMTLSGIWSSNISSSAAQSAVVGKNTRIAQPAASPLTSIAEAIYRALLVQAMNIYVVLLDTLLPLGAVARAMAVCLSGLACAFAAFDTVWSHQQLPLQQRFTQIESHWSWYMGFGLMTAAATFFASPVVNGTVYSIFFPWLVLIAMHVKPEKQRTPTLPVLAPFKWIIYAILQIIPLLKRKRPLPKQD